MGGYGGHRQQNDFMKQIIKELDKLIEEIKNIQENIYGEKLFVEWGIESKKKVNDFINKNLDFNETLLQQLEKINCVVMAESELKEAIEKLVLFCTKIKELLIKSKDIEDFKKWLDLTNYKEELDLEKKDINAKIYELNAFLENAKSVNSELNKKVKESFNIVFLKTNTKSFESTEITSNNNANKWLWASGGVIFILITIVFCQSNYVNGLVGIKKELCYISKYDNTILYIAYAKYISSYILIYSILIYAIKVSIKNYNANKHNEIVNRNKKLTLAIALDLISQGKNPELLDIAAKEVFTLQDTGYNNTTEEKTTSNFVNTIVDTATKKI